MSSLKRGLLGFAVSLVAAFGCVQEASIDNDRTGSAIAGNTSRDAGSDEDTSDDGTSDDVGPDAEPEDDSSGEGPDEPELDAGRDASSRDAGPSKDGSASAPDATTAAVKDASVAMSVVSGSAATAKCSSYGKPKGEMCGSYYCGVTEAQIAAEMPADSLCNDVGAVCEGRLVTAVGSCARSVKSANPTASNAKLRPLLQDCVYKDAEFKQIVTPQCLGCFLDAATCAGDKCLLQCLTGDSAGCDSCRAKNNCEKPVFSCAKLPSPL